MGIVRPNERPVRKMWFQFAIAVKAVGSSESTCLDDEKFLATTIFWCRLCKSHSAAQVGNGCSFDPAQLDSMCNLTYGAAIRWARPAPTVGGGHLCPMTKASEA